MDNPGRETDRSRFAAAIDEWRALILDVSWMLVEVPGDVITSVSIVVPRSDGTAPAGDVIWAVQLVASELGLAAEFDERPESTLIRLSRRGPGGPASART